MLVTKINVLPIATLDGIVFPIDFERLRVNAVKKGYVKKARYPVTLKLMDGEIVDGFVYMQVDERLVDMLNDDRSFVPFEDGDREMHVINKSSISKIKIGY